MLGRWRHQGCWTTDNTVQATLKGRLKVTGSQGESMYRQRLSLVALALLLAVPVFAQKFTSQIRGTVSDDADRPVPNARVSVVGTPMTRKAIRNWAIENPTNDSWNE